MKNTVMMLLQEGKFVEAKNEILKLNVVDIAQLIDGLNGDKMLMLFRLLPKEYATNVFNHLSYEKQQYIIETITDKEIKNIIDNLFLDDTVDLIEEMPANVVKKIIKNTDENKRNLINQFLRYPEDSAGSLMTIEFVDLRKEMSVSDALEHIRKTGVDKETIDISYVINKNRVLEGWLPIRKLILSDGESLIKDILDANIITIQTHDDQEEIARLFKKYDLIAMPVVDYENRLVGIITIDDIVDIIEQENTEDFQIMAGMAPSDEKYLKTSVFTLAKNRVIWLMVLMISATFTGRIMSKYQNVLESVVILATFIPMLMDTGGNAGSQSSTLVIRGLALEEIQLKDIFKVLWKEFRVSLIVGIILTSVNFIRLLLIERVSLEVNLTVCISLLITVILSKVVGCILPILAKKAKLDPAIMAGPLITTIVDAVSIFAYFNIATKLINI